VDFLAADAALDGDLRSRGIAALKDLETLGVEPGKSEPDVSAFRASRLKQALSSERDEVQLQRQGLCTSREVQRVGCDDHVGAVEGGGEDNQGVDRVGPLP
jgi:hypothetical protein